MGIPRSLDPWISRLCDHELEREIIKHQGYLRDLHLKDCKKLIERIENLLMEKRSRSNKETVPILEKSANLPAVIHRCTCPDLPRSTGPIPLGIRNGTLAKVRGTTSRREGDGISRARQGVGGGESSGKVVRVMSSKEEELKEPEWERLLKEQKDLLQGQEGQVQQSLRLLETMRKAIQEKEELLQQSLRQQETMRREMEDAVRETQALRQEKIVQLMSSEKEELQKRGRERLLKEKEELLQQSLRQQEAMKKEMEDAARETHALKQKLEESHQSTVDCQIATGTRTKLQWERLLQEKEDSLKHTLNAQESMQKEMEDAVRASQVLKQNFVQGMECVVCLDEFGDDLSKQRAHYQACNHANICFGCATTLWRQRNRRCPSCNTRAIRMPLRLPAKIFL